MTSIKEQICAEIKAQKNDAEGSYVPGEDNNYWYGKVVLCDELLAFLDTLPEQPVESLPEWKWVKPDKQYPVGITREMDVNGDWQYCMSSGRLYEYCQYLSLAELELKSVDAGPFPILEDENAADKKAVREIVKTVHKEVTRQVKEMVGEQPVEGLEEAAGAYLDNHKPLTRYNWGDLMDAFKAGAEWGAEHLRDTTKMMPEELEEAASRGGFDYVDDIVQETPGHRWNDHDVEFGYRDGFIDGAKWQKELDDLETADLLAIAHLQGMEQQKAKIMEGAVDGEVVKDITNKLAVTAKNVNLDKFKFGDKVRVIVIKED